MTATAAAAFAPRWQRLLDEARDLGCLVEEGRIYYGTEGHHDCNLDTKDD